MSLLKGSWDLVARVIIRVTILIIAYKKLRHRLELGGCLLYS